MLGRTSDAVVFDMDGVLCDSEPSIAAAAAEMLRRRYGIVATREDFLPFVDAPPGGVPRVRVAPRTCEAGRRPTPRSGTTMGPALQPLPRGSPMLSQAVRSLIAAGPLAHVVTLTADGSPHVSMAWVGVDGDELVIATLFDQPKLRNLRRDPRIALSFVTGGRNPIGLDNYLVLHGHARVTEGGAAEILAELARTYLGPDVVFPPMPNPPPGFVTRITVDRVSGLGPGAPAR